MASGKNRRTQEQKDLATQQQQAFNTASTAQMQQTPEQAAVAKYNTDILNYKGDYAGLPNTGWASGMVSKAKSERANQNRGAYTFGAQYADPNLLSALGTQEESDSAQQEQLGFENAVQSTLAGAQGNALQSAALTANRNASVLGPTAQLAGQYNTNYLNLASQPGFWSQALLAGIAGAGNAIKYTI